jgi:hypothetical protein
MGCLRLVLQLSSLKRAYELCRRNTSAKPSTVDTAQATFHCASNHFGKKHCRQQQRETAARLPGVLADAIPRIGKHGFYAPAWLGPTRHRQVLTF